MWNWGGFYVLSPSKMVMRSAHHIPPAIPYTGDQARSLTGVAAIQFRLRKVQGGEGGALPNKPANPKQWERKSSLKLRLDRRIWESSPLVCTLAEFWLLVWMRSGHVNPKSHGRLKVSWEGEEKIKLKLLVSTQAFTYCFCLQENAWLHNSESSSST